jgi:murein DD-endopeptidase MepM/ murein hydrolase activator NlpD
LWAVFGPPPGGLTIRRLSAAVVALVVLFASVFVGSAAATDSTGSLPILTPRRLAPTVPGAPFVPSTSRTNVILARLSAMQQLDALNTADAALRLRHSVISPSDDAGAGVADTIRIMESQIDALERDVAILEAEVAYLNIETAPLGIGTSVFPLASLRKPFFNDWGQPRSGGRSHIGTDLLAQTGVELRAIEDGYVEQVSNGSLGGLSIYLRGDSGSRYYYAHLDEVGDFEDDERIYAGQAVGTVGDSGNARGSPHLHMQWSPTGESNWENPYPLLNALFGDGAAAEAVAAIDEVPAAPTPVGALTAER